MMKHVGLQKLFPLINAVGRNGILRKIVHDISGVKHMKYKGPPGW